MDTSDPAIVFDGEGVCNHCRNFELNSSKRWLPNAEGERRLRGIAERIRHEGRKKEYDCVIGLSGGLDSSYLAYMVKKLQLRPLVIHVDTGWNSELAVKNIESIVKALNFDLFTQVIDWDEMRDVQVAYLRSGIANQDVPQDHAIFASLYHMALKYNVRFVFTGSNLATECILPQSWGYDAMDSIQLRAIHKRFGQRPLATFPILSLYSLYIDFPYLHRMRNIQMLNFLPYSKESARQTLEQELDWRYYGGKHHESRWTRFFQGFYLPARFGYEKRRAHLASLVTTGQMPRAQALAEMQKEHYPPTELNEDRTFVLKKLGLSHEDFEALLAAPRKSYLDYPHEPAWMKRFKWRLRNIWQ